jgi:C4-dicarboxylate-specific signal transduction histidine kinase
MIIHSDFDQIIDRDYCGRILRGDYSERLKRRVSEYIACYRAFEKAGNPAIPYISAWEEAGKEIWYEFVSTRFTKLLQCDSSKVAEFFQRSVLDRRIYKYPDADKDIEKEVISRNELDSARKMLREDVKKAGTIDAVYKISLEENRIIWLKDLATVEAYEQDGIYLSRGCLTVVTKEMRAEEERVNRERVQALLETAGAVCHELNQPIQSILSYCETMLMETAKDDPMNERFKKIMDQTRRMGDITKKLARITKYETKDYVQGVRIVDIDKSSQEEC